MSGVLPRTTFPILAVEPSPDIPDGSWRHDAERSRRDKELTVYVVQSTNPKTPEVEYECVINHRLGLWYCTCEARRVCKHLRGVVYWMEYRSMVEYFRTMGLAEQQRRQREHVEYTRRNAGPTRFWRVDRDALARVMGERVAA